MALTDILTYPEVLTRLNQTTTEAPATRVLPLITAVTQHLEGVLGCVFVQREYVELHRVDQLGVCELFLRRRPIVSVTSIVDDEGTSIPSTDYYVYASTGRLRHKTAWPMSEGVWHITVLGGWFPDTARVGEDVKQAGCILIKDGMTVRGSETVVSESVGPVSVTYADPSQTSGGLLPTEVSRLLAQYRNLRVF